MESERIKKFAFLDRVVLCPGRYARMKANLKKGLLILAVIAALAVIAVTIFVLTFDINRYKPRIEAAATQAAGMKVSINGKLKLEIFPDIGVSAEDILVQRQDAVIASVKKAALEMKLMPLFRGEILIKQVGLIDPKLFVVKDKRGHFNFETPGKPRREGLPAGFEVGNIAVDNGQVLYTDEQTGAKTEANGCDIGIGGLVFPGGSVSSAIFTGDIYCEKVKTKGLAISDFNAEIKAGDGKFSADPMTLEIFGGDGKGKVTGTLSGKAPSFAIDFAITKFRFEEVLGAFNQKKYITGELDLDVHLTMKGKDANEITRSAQGTVSLRGENLVHETIDLDRMLEMYEKTRRMSLVDLGGFFMAGPLGAFLTKGYDFGSLYESTLGGKSTIPELVSEWNVQNGVAQAADVAFSTKKNRVAMKGRLDFVRDQFENVNVAVVDEKGCVVFSQKIYGNFSSPKIEKTDILKSLADPVFDLFGIEKPRELFKGKCEMFYDGSVKHPGQ